MRTITLGLALSLLGGVAMAQTPPVAPASPPPALKQPAVGPTPIPAPPAAQQQAQAAPPAAPATGQPPVPAPSGPPEGMIVETPNGFYLVRPGDPNPQRLDMGRNGGMSRHAAWASPAMGQPGMGQPGMDRPGMGQPGMDRPGMDWPMMGQNGPAAMAEGDDAMGDMVDRGTADDRPPPPRPPHRGPGLAAPAGGQGRAPAHPHAQPRRQREMPRTTNPSRPASTRSRS